MQIIDYFKDENQARWLRQIAGYEWRAAHFLAELLREGRFHEVLGEGTLYLLTDGERLVSFLTLAQRDCIADASLSPWIGFVHTAPEYRGHRHVGTLIEHAARMVGQNGAKRVYLCTDHTGLYEKYGFTYMENRISIYGEDSRVYSREVDTGEPGRELTIRFGQPDDLSRWVGLVRRVAWNFPGLETEAALAEHEATVAKCIGKGNAICAEAAGRIVGVLLFSRRLNMLCCMAVAPEYRRRGAAQGMFGLMLTIADPARDVTVTTFREDDPKGEAPRAFYEKQGFVPAELVAENGYPFQRFIRRSLHAEG